MKNFMGHKKLIPQCPHISDVEAAFPGFFLGRDTGKVRVGEFFPVSVFFCLSLAKNIQSKKMLQEKKICKIFYLPKN